MNFNPRSLAGATPFQASSIFATINISIHAPSRERHNKGIIYDTLLLISIHAPSRERHFSTGTAAGTAEDFNPRSLAGATSSLKLYVFRRLKFQSTLPRGSDGASTSKRKLHYNFNPRSLAGATLILFCRRLVVLISIHAPSRERLWLWCHTVLQRYFNPRSLAGAT